MLYKALYSIVIIHPCSIIDVIIEEPSCTDYGESVQIFK